MPKTPYHKGLLVGSDSRKNLSMVLLVPHFFCQIYNNWVKLTSALVVICILSNWPVCSGCNVIWRQFWIIKRKKNLYFFILFEKNRQMETSRPMERFFLSRMIKSFPCKMNSCVLTNFSKNLSKQCMIIKRNKRSFVQQDLANIIINVTLIIRRAK